MTTLPSPPPGPADHDGPSPDALPTHVRVVPWIDPVVDRRGHDPRSCYVETFWISVLGPTATWLMRRLVAGFDDHPDGYELDVEATARSLGLSLTKGTASPFAKAVQRCVMFGMAQRLASGWAVRRRIPVVSQRHLDRMPEPLQLAHQRWTRADLRLDELARAHTLASAMLAAGDDCGVLEPQLVRLGIPAPAAAEACELVRARS
ncbi:MAG: hypothetical protein H0U21_12610 [Acidimicrobiia bacterium]|nr:hypothetical protein [Acidimicrobiia bacterium]